MIQWVKQDAMHPFKKWQKNLKNLPKIHNLDLIDLKPWNPSDSKDMYSKFSDRIMVAQYKFLTGVDPLAKAINVL